MTEPGKTNARQTATPSVLLALAAALLVIATLESARVPATAFRSSVASLVGVFLVSLFAAFERLVVPTTAQALLAAILAWPLGSGRLARLRRWAIPVPGLVASVHAWSVLLPAPALAGHPALLALAAALSAYLSAAALRLDARATGREPLGGVWACRAVALPGIAAFAAAEILDRRLLRGFYPEIRLFALESSFLALAAAISLGLVSMSRLSLRLVRALALAATCVALVVPLATLVPGTFAIARSLVAEHTIIGRKPTSFFEGIEKSPTPAFSSESARRVFVERSGMPPFPNGFALEGRNVLLVMSESTRFDQTSLADPSLGTTPELVRLAASDSLVFEKAFSPSSSTILTLAALFTMTYPSASHIEIGRRSWDGRYLDDNLSVVEIFRDAGYETFWAGHDRNHAFSSSMRGFEQGFDTRRLVFEPKRGEAEADEPTRNPLADERVADLAMEAIDRAAGRPFFGWVFFVSPHAEYLIHDPSRPSASPVDRYRQEIRYMDRQFGRLIDFLGRRGLIDRTIVAFMGDHGEEFGEHGGSFHSSTLYREQIHVPLVVRAPGLGSGRIATPVSTMYLFPWLLLRGGPAMRQAALARLAGEIAPMLEATDGAAVSELVTRDRWLYALVWEREKLIVSLASGMAEIYDTSRDRGELENMLAASALFSSPLSRFAAGYRRATSAVHRIAFSSDKRQRRPRVLP